MSNSHTGGFMFNLTRSLAFLAIIGMIILGCADNRNPVESLSQGNNGTSIHTPSFTVIQADTLGAFTVQYLGRTVDSVHATTKFTYVLTGPTIQVAFTLENPACVGGSLVAYYPANGVNFNVDPVIYPSIRWNPPTTSSTTIIDTFSYTFSGYEKEGPIQVGIKTNPATYYGVITGPSKYFNISGSTYADANNNGMFDASETGIQNVTIDLFNSVNTLVATTTSDVNGNYLFRDQLCGTYTVAVDTTTLTTSTKNNYLANTTPLKLSVSIGPDSKGNNFGFTPQTTKLVNDIKSGTLPTNGGAANAWKKQFQSALSGNGNPVVSKDTLLAYLGRINSLELANPFQFTLDSAGLQKAFNILSNPTKTDLSNLLQQLLATELNYERGLGISDLSLELVVIGWAESISASIGGTAYGVVKVEPAAVYSLATSATTVCTTINSGGGGGLQ